MLGLSFVLFAVMMVSAAPTPRPMGYLMGLSGLAYIVQGCVLGSEGFSATNTGPTLLGIVLVLAWSIWLLIIAGRMEESVEAPGR